MLVASATTSFFFLPFSGDYRKAGCDCLGCLCLVSFVWRFAGFCGISFFFLLSTVLGCFVSSLFLPRFLLEV
jgi:hypothetical protein